MKISIGWKNSEGHSEEQIKSFKSEEDAYQFCVKHINNIMRIGYLRIQRNTENFSIDAPDVIEISEETIRAAISEGAEL